MSFAKIYHNEEKFKPFLNKQKRKLALVELRALRVLPERVVIGTEDKALEPVEKNILNNAYDLEDTYEGFDDDYVPRGINCAIMYWLYELKEEYKKDLEELKHRLVRVPEELRVEEVIEKAFSKFKIKDKKLKKYLLDKIVIH